MNKFRRFMVKFVVTILFFWCPTLRKKLTKSLFFVSPLKILRNVYEYHFKQPTKFKYYVSLTMCVKDEAEYIREWIEYYLLQGVDHFYIYNNNGTDNTEEIIKPYIDKGIVTWREYPGLGKQAHIYNDAVDNYKNETQWMGFIDIDEFIVPHKHETLATALKEYEKYSQLLLHWVFYGSSGHKEKTNGLVIERFTKHQKGVNHHTKSIINPRAILYADVHASEVMGDTVNEKKELVYKKSEPTAEILQINHYVIKSFEEFSNKKNKGRTDIKSIELNNQFFQKHDYNDVEDEQLMSGYVQKIKLNLAGGNV